MRFTAMSQLKEECSDTQEWERVVRDRIGIPDNSNTAKYFIL